MHAYASKGTTYLACLYLLSWDENNFTLQRTYGEEDKKGIEILC